MVSLELLMPLILPQTLLMISIIVIHITEGRMCRSYINWLQMYFPLHLELIFNDFNIPHRHTGVLWKMGCVHRAASLEMHQLNFWEIMWVFPLFRMLSNRYNDLKSDNTGADEELQHGKYTSDKSLHFYVFISMNILEKYQSIYWFWNFLLSKNWHLPIKSSIGQALW